MALKSMTGYGCASFTADGNLFTVEASSVNRRGLEISISAPSDWVLPLERLAGAWVRDYASRGKITLAYSATGGGSDAALTWDSAAFAESFRRIEAEARALGVPFAPDSATLLHLAELLRARRAPLTSPEDEALRPVLEAQTRLALAGLVSMREREGANLAADFQARIAVLENLHDSILRISAGTVPRHREMLLARLRQAGLELNLDDERVLKEVAIFADRCDTSEETTRLHSHLEQFRAIISEGSDVGRKLDFLCQEINRELNTIGSKANSVEITRAVIEGKNELERIREQVQNVE